MYILVILILNGSSYPLQTQEFSSLQSCNNAKTYLVNSPQLKSTKTLIECFQK